MFLPIAQCSSKQPTKIDQPPEKPRIEVLVPVKEFKEDWISSLPLISIYLWPLVLLGVSHYIRRLRFLAVVSAVEVLLASGSLYLLVETVRLWGAIRYGGIVVIAAFVAYLLVSAISFYRYVREPSN
jgi:hypothetical protein